MHSILVNAAVTGRYRIMSNVNIELLHYYVDLNRRALDPINLCSDKHETKDSCLGSVELTIE